MIHELKIWPEHFDNVAAYRKRFELRKADRDFKVGDRLRLREWQPADVELKDPHLNLGPRGYTGRQLEVRVLHAIRGPLFGLEQGFVILSISNPNREHVWHKCNCNRTGCQFCDGGLGACDACGGIEGSLPTECPRKRMTSKEQDDIHKGRIDFTEAEGWHDGDWRRKEIEDAARA